MGDGHVSTNPYRMSRKHLRQPGRCGGQLACRVDLGPVKGAWIRGVHVATGSVCGDIGVLAPPSWMCSLRALVLCGFVSGH